MGFEIEPSIVRFIFFGRYGDMRQVMGFEIVQMWQSLGKLYL